MNREQRMAYNRMRDCIELAKMCNLNQNISVVVNAKRDFRAAVKHNHDELAKSIRNRTRSMLTRDGEGISYYRIFPANWTDDDIRDYIDEFTVHGDLLIDCTGKLCTVGWHVNRTPSGVVIIHRMALDI